MSGRRIFRRPRPGAIAVTVACVIAILLLGLWTWWACSEAASLGGDGEVPARRTTYDSMAVTYTYDGEMICWYVLIDPDNGVQYIVNDRGGCCPRVSYDGTIMGVWGENAS